MTSIENLIEVGTSITLDGMDLKNVITEQKNGKREQRREERARAELERDRERAELEIEREKIERELELKKQKTEREKSQSELNY